MVDPQKSVGEEPELPRVGRLAGIDFGTVRVGIAICDVEQRIASPYEVYRRRTRELDQSYFQTLVEREEVAGFVVGLPVHMSGDESGKSRETRQFGHWLSEVTGRPVVYVDERYTTVQARELCRQAGAAGKRKDSLDKIAAQLILSAFLERGSG